MNREYRRRTARALARQWSKARAIHNDERGILATDGIRHHPAATATRGDVRTADPVGDRIPFYRASDHYVENFHTSTRTPGTTQIDSEPVNIPPGGFLRGILLTVSGASGVLGAGTLAADYPWILFKSIVVEDINGSPLFGPLEGFLVYLVNKYGGVHFQGDPASHPDYVGTINAVFTLWIPFEIRSDGLGSLANTDARAQYRLRYSIETLANLTGSTGATTAPTLTINAYSYTWSQVEETAMDGTPQEQTPPGLATTQFWTREQPAVAAAAQTIKHNRVGNLIRNLIYVTRTDAAQGATTQATPRANTLLTNPIRLRLDNRYLKVDAIASIVAEMGRKYGLSTFATTREAGVYVYSWADGPDRHPSPADDSDYLETAEATFLQLEVTMGVAGTLTILTNDVAPYGAIPND